MAQMLANTVADKVRKTDTGVVFTGAGDTGPYISREDLERLNEVLKHSNNGDTFTFDFKEEEVKARCRNNNGKWHADLESISGDIATNQASVEQAIEAYDEAVAEDEDEYSFEVADGVPEELVEAVERNNERWLSTAVNVSPTGMNKRGSSDQLYIDFEDAKTVSFYDIVRAGFNPLETKRLEDKEVVRLFVEPREEEDDTHPDPDGVIEYTYPSGTTYRVEGQYDGQRVYVYKNGKEVGWDFINYVVKNHDW